MSITLFDLVYRTARMLNIMVEGVATGGSSTTIVDTGRIEDSGRFDGGTAFITYDAAGLNAAPQGQMAVVDSYVTGTITLISALTADVAAGDRYAVTKKRYTMDTITQKVNEVLGALENIPYTDTTLTSVASQTEYTMPSANANLDPVEVWYQTNTSNVLDNQWAEITGWRIKRADVGTADTLIIPQLTAGVKIMLVYNRPHPELRIYSDKLSERIHPDLIIYPAALSLAMSKNDNDPVTVALINFLSKKSDMAKIDHVIRGVKHKSRLFKIGQWGIP